MKRSAYLLNRELSCVPKKKSQKNKRRIKYLIVASIRGEIYGAFDPNREEEAKNYLEKCRKEEKHIEFNLHFVSNLNQFYSNLKYAKRERKANQRNVND